MTWDAEQKRAWRRLATAHPWPEQRPDISPLVHGWITHDAQFHRLLEGLLDPLVVEVGAWLGKTSLLLLQHRPDLRLVAIDRWRGFRFEHERTESSFETYCTNLWKHRHRCTMVRASAECGMLAVYDAGLLPDLIYIDAAHDYASVYRDVSVALALFPRAILCGDDYEQKTDREGVALALDKATSEYGFDVEIHGRFWEST